MNKPLSPFESEMALPAEIAVAHSYLRELASVCTRPTDLAALRSSHRLAVAA